MASRVMLKTLRIIRSSVDDKNICNLYVMFIYGADDFLECTKGISVGLTNG